MGGLDLWRSTNLRSMKGRNTLRPLGLFLDGGLLFSALGADQSQEVLGVEGVAANGLLSGGTQGDVDAAIVGEDQKRQIAHHFLAFVGAQIGIVGHLLFNLVGSQLVLFAERLQLKMISGDAVFDQEILGAFHAALCEFLVVFLGAARVGVTAEDQVGIRHVFQIVYEVRRQSLQDFCLTVEQATLGMLGGGP